MQLLILLSVFFEGISSLGIELYALRITGFFVGQSSAIAGIILATVLLACALGYYIGGVISQKTTKILFEGKEELDKNANDNKIMNILLKKASLYFLIAGVIYLIAAFIQIPLLYQLMIWRLNPLIIALIVGAIFSFGVFFGCCAVPILAQYLSLKSGENGSAGKYAGIMVAVTTLGSVVGSTIMPIFLIPLLGLNFSLLIMVVLLLTASLLTKIVLKERKIINYVSIIFVSVFVCGYYFYSISTTYSQNQVLNFNKNIYSTKINDWMIFNVKNKEGEILNILTAQMTAAQSCWNISRQEDCAEYNVYLRKIAESLKPEKMTVIGGAGMVMPYIMAKEDLNLKINVIELDSEIKTITEKFLDRELPSNINLLTMDGRQYINLKSVDVKKEEKFEKDDVIILDAFNSLKVATSLYSQESLQKIKNIGKNVLANVVVKKDLEDKYTQSLLHTWLSIFPESHALVVQKDRVNEVNIILCSNKCGDGEIVGMVEAIPINTLSFFNTNKEKKEVIHSDYRSILEYYSLI